MNVLHLQSRIKDYQVHFVDDFDFLDTLSDVRPRVVIIDKKVTKLYHHIFNKSFAKEELITFDAIEENKTIDSCLNLYDQINQKASRKNTTIISIGGGITQDVTGFVASTLYRGVRWIYIPTTFLAQTDSCIGSKTSLNYKSYKNLIGTFYPPELIYINTEFLKTLSDLDFFSGIGETIKLQLMKEGQSKDIKSIKGIIDRALQKDDYLSELIRDNMQVKISYMKNDEFDRGKRNLLNYGHCFGHALETASAYQIPHGIAVLVGILFANIVSNARNLVSDQMLKSLATNLIIPYIPFQLERSFFDEYTLLESMRKDKKKIGNLLTVVIPGKDFELAIVNDVTDREFKDSLKMLKKYLFAGEAGYD